MAIPPSEQRILQQKSGNRCAFPQCRRTLTAGNAPRDRDVVLGEMAHIVGESVNGPRGASPFTVKERNRADNLILLCNTHHQLIDSKPEVYTVEVLRRMKLDHERWVETTLGRGVEQVQDLPAGVYERLYSTLLPVARMPFYIYSGPCSLTESEATRQLASLRNNEVAPFIIRQNTLFAFQDLREPDNPFHRIIEPDMHHRDLIATWASDPDRHHWLVMLLNRALNKLTGRRKLHFDKQHQRYFFQAPMAGEEVSVTYQPLNQQRAKRKVVWQPISKKTGEGRGFWFHRAVALRFHAVGENQWCLSIRPELRVTVDGINPLASEHIGRQVTRKKSRMYNYDLLGEIQFWRDYLSRSSAQISLSFGTNQKLIIVNRLMEGDLQWPGIPSQHAKPFKNVSYIDEEETWAELEAEEIDIDEESVSEADEELLFDEADEDELFSDDIIDEDDDAR